MSHFFPEHLTLHASISKFVLKSVLFLVHGHFRQLQHQIQTMMQKKKKYEEFVPMKQENLKK